MVTHDQAVDLQQAVAEALQQFGLTRETQSAFISPSTARAERASRRLMQERLKKGSGRRPPVTPSIGGGELLSVSASNS